MAVPITAGEHRVMLSFRPDGFGTGLLVTLVSLVIFILLTVVRSVVLPKFEARREKAREQKRLAAGLTDSLEAYDPYPEDEEVPYGPEELPSAHYVHSDSYEAQDEVKEEAVVEHDLDYQFRPGDEDEKA